MKMQRDYLYSILSRAVSDDVHCVRFPAIRGGLNTVYLVDAERGTYVVKFNHRDLAQKNQAAARLMRDRNIPVPDVRAATFYGHWVEVYPQMPGRTLYECVGRGMELGAIDDIYRDIVTAFAKMDDIPFKTLAGMPAAHFHRVARYNTRDTNNFVAGMLIGGAVRALNMGPRHDMGLYHANISPKNIIVSDDGRFAGLVDMDEIAICNKSFAFGAMAAQYGRLGGDVDALCDMYEDISGRILGRHRVRMMAALNNAGKLILGKTTKSR